MFIYLSSRHKIFIMFQVFKKITCNEKGILLQRPVLEIHHDFSKFLM